MTKQPNPEKAWGQKVILDQGERGHPFIFSPTEPPVSSGKSTLLSQIIDERKKATH